MRTILKFTFSAFSTACVLLVGAVLATGTVYGDLEPITTVDCDSAICDNTCAGLGPCAAPCASCNCSGANGVYFCTD